MPRIYFDPKRPKPMPMQASSRFWCGAALGLLIGLFIALSTLSSSASLSILAIVGSVLLCGWLSVYYGEDFWDDIRGFLHALRFFW